MKTKAQYKLMRAMEFEIRNMYPNERTSIEMRSFFIFVVMAFIRTAHYDFNMEIDNMDDLTHSVINFAYGQYEVTW
jgi:hypothetical protein